MRWLALPPPRLLSEDLITVPEPFALALRARAEAAPGVVSRTVARAMLDQPDAEAAPWPAWLTPHQVSAARRLSDILARYGGAVLADAVGLGKSYVSLAVALHRPEPFALLVPAVLLGQWRELLDRLGAAAPIVTHEAFSARSHVPRSPELAPCRLIVVDEAHRFRNPDTRRYRALARWCVGRRVLLVTATPVHNRLDDVLHLFRLFVRDHALASLGVPSLRRAAQADGAGDVDRAVLLAAAARLIVARSRERAQSGYRRAPGSGLVFPAHLAREGPRVAPVDDSTLATMIPAVQRLRAGGSAGALLRVMLLKRLGSSIAAFRQSLDRHDAYLDLHRQAAADGRRLSRVEFQRCFPRDGEGDVQLAFLPLLLDAGTLSGTDEDRRELAALRALARPARREDPKLRELERLLRERPPGGKTIVFTESQMTARYLLRALAARGLRAAAVYGAGGHFASGVSRRRDVLRAFAPLAQHAPAPPAALETEVLIATDLLSEGLNLQDARQIVHYDLPWSPARLAQRLGRIDRLGSPHRAVESIALRLPEPLEAALRLEERLARKAVLQARVGARGRLDWCDRLAVLASSSHANGSAGAGMCAAVRARHEAVVLAVRIAASVELIVVRNGAAAFDAAAATALLEHAIEENASAVPIDRRSIEQAVTLAAPLVRERFLLVQNARWRATDRDRLARRLIPWVLSAARRAARRRDAARLGDLDALVSRLASGMTAGEELLLEDLLRRPETLKVSALLEWHRNLPPIGATDDEPTISLIGCLALPRERDALDVPL